MNKIRTYSPAANDARHGCKPIKTRDPGYELVPLPVTTEVNDIVIHDGKRQHVAAFDGERAVLEDIELTGWEP